MEFKCIIKFKTKEEMLRILKLRESYEIGTKVHIQGNGIKIKLNEEGDVYIDQPFYTEAVESSPGFPYECLAECIINTPYKEKIYETADANNIGIATYMGD